MGIIYTMTEAMEWLDAQIAWREEGRALRNLNNRIGVCDAPVERMIHIFENIASLADVLGAKLKYRECEMGGGYHYFMYKGYKVFQYKGEDNE